MSQKKAEESFWESMQKSAEPVRFLPSWTKAGINLSERNFTTFRSASAPEAATTIVSSDAKRDAE
jgi:hypothetical protein